VTTAEALDRLRRHGELHLIRGHWVKLTRPGDGYEVLPASVGLQLAQEGLAVMMGRTLRPA
jgi:hypothetical protein